MSSVRTASILGTGSYIPEKVVTNDDLSKFLDTSDEWIRTRTGIRERHLASEDEGASDMAVKAAQRALDRAGISRDLIDFIILATGTPDYPIPNTASRVQDKLGLPHAGQCYSVKRFTQAYVITTCAFFVCKKSLGLQKNIKTSKKGLTNPQKFEAPPVSKGTTPIVNKEDLL